MMMLMMMMMKNAIPAWLLLVYAGPLAAAEARFDPEARARAVAPFVDEQTIGVVHVDLDRFASGGDQPGARGKPRRGLALYRSWAAALKGAGARDLFAIFSLADIPELPVIVVPLGAGADAEAIGKVLCGGKDRDGTSLAPARGLLGLPMADCRTVNRAVCAGSRRAVERLRGLKAAARPELAKAFAAAGDTTAQLLIVPDADTRRVFEEMAPELPAEIGGGPSTALPRGLLWAALGADFGRAPSARVVIQSRDADAARSLHSWIKNVSLIAAQRGVISHAIPEADKLFAALTPEVDGDRLTLDLKGSDAQLAQLKDLGRLLLMPTERTASVNNLKQIGLAMHNYANIEKTFPPAYTTDRAGEPLLSWRVLILPYLEQETLFKRFHLEEPWDSPPQQGTDRRDARRLSRPGAADRRARPDDLPRLGGRRHDLPRRQGHQARRDYRWDFEHDPHHRGERRARGPLDQAGRPPRRPEAVVLGTDRALSRRHERRLRGRLGPFPPEDDGRRRPAEALHPQRRRMDSQPVNLRPSARRGSPRRMG